MLIRSERMSADSLVVRWSTPHGSENFSCLEVELKCGQSQFGISKGETPEGLLRRQITTDEDLANMMTTSVVETLWGICDVDGESKSGICRLCISIPADVRDRAIDAVRSFAGRITFDGPAEQTFEL